MNPGIYGLGGQIVTPIQGPFSGVADARKLLPLQVVVVAGGGSPATVSASGVARGGGGAGGMLEQTLGISLGSVYTVSIGAGGATSSTGSQGSPSRFDSIVAVGGGWQDVNGAGRYGGSGPGTVLVASQNQGLTLSSTQGNNGALGNGNLRGGGGGGAGSAGVASGTTNGGDGGAGKVTNIMATATTLAGGGGGGTQTASGVGGNGGSGGGGTGGGSTAAATNGTANTGGGGGGSGGFTGLLGSGSGGSGIVVLRWNASLAQITISAGLTYTSTMSGTDRVISITAGTGTVTFN